MHWLLYALLVYLVGCYLGGLYLVLRVGIGGRLGRALGRALSGGGRRRLAGATAASALRTDAVTADDVSTAGSHVRESEAAAADTAEPASSPAAATTRRAA